MKTKTKKLKHLFTSKRPAFTLAETLITLGVIGVVAAVTLPTLLTNIQERVRQEQVRTVKYKFTKATEKMNSLGLIGHYDSTMDFVNELKKHMSIAKICDSSKLNECWGYTSFTNANASTTYKVADLKTGKSLEALQFNSGDTDTVGIVTGDGVPIILTYGKECQALDETKQYQWSTVNGKPETNATAGCVSMVFDINGPKAPNRVGTDVRTMNSILDMVNLGLSYKPLTTDECKKHQKELGIQRCYSGTDYWAGAVKECHDLGLHMPSMAILAKIAQVRYGIQVEIKERIDFLDNCNEYTGTYSCKPKTEITSQYPLSLSFSGFLWSNEEDNINGQSEAWLRSFYADKSYAIRNGRSSHSAAICVSD